jgi:hypothetical protein
MIDKLDKVNDLLVWQGKWFIFLIRWMIYKFDKVNDVSLIR